MGCKFVFYLNVAEFLPISYARLLNICLTLRAANERGPQKRSLYMTGHFSAQNILHCCGIDMSSDVHVDSMDVMHLLCRSTSPLCFATLYVLDTLLESVERFSTLGPLDRHFDARH